MSLLPNRFQINDELPSLGKLVREAIQPEPCKFREFESPPHKYEIKEWECRQIKGAAGVENGDALVGVKQAMLDSFKQEMLMGIAKQPGEWKDCSEDMPDLPAGRYELRNKRTLVEYPSTTRWIPLSIAAGLLLGRELQYREIHE